MKYGRFHWQPLSALLLVLWAGGVGCSDSLQIPTPPEPPTPPNDSSLIHYGYRVVASYPHDSGAFTQGLAYVDSMLIEGTGYYKGRSTLRRVEIETGTVIQSIYMPEANFFGEGVTVWNDRVIQLTWLDSLAVVYNEETFDEIGRFSYPTEGWGLTNDGTRFIMSDGTDTLYCRDPDTFAEIGRVAVKDSTASVSELNELEYIGGLIYANVYGTDFIVMISPASGRVVGRVNLTGLLSPRPPSAGVLNGIAYDTDRNRLFVTGKLWPTLFEIELVPED